MTAIRVYFLLIENTVNEGSMFNAGTSESAAQLIARISSKNRPSLQNLLPEILPRNAPNASQIIEISGESNMGKTVHLMELVAQTILPTIYGGKEAEAIVIDTNSNFAVPFLLPRILEKYILHNRMTVDSTSDTEDLRTATDNVEELVFDALKSVWIFSCYSSDALDAILSTSVDELLSTRTRIGLIAIDSIAAFYWSETGKVRMDTYFRQKLQILRSINRKYRTVLLYTKPAYFGTKTNDNVSYCIELVERGDGVHFLAHCHCNDAETTTTLSRCYLINKFGIQWMRSSLK